MEEREKTLREHLEEAKQENKKLKDYGWDVYQENLTLKKELAELEKLLNEKICG